MIIQTRTLDIETTQIFELPEDTDTSTGVAIVSALRKADFLVMYEAAFNEVAVTFTTVEDWTGVEKIIERIKQIIVSALEAK